jgi:branched-chain amino acid transport system permease protein
MMGATIAAKSGFAAALLSLPSSRRDEDAARERGLAALGAVGLATNLASVRCDRLQHSELRFVEIARALMSEPAFLLLDEPAAGLSGEEIGRLAGLVTAISQRGVGVLLVEHHTDLIFDICQHVTVLNLGRVLAAGSCAEIRAHKEVVSAYLGS